MRTAATPSAVRTAGSDPSEGLFGTSIRFAVGVLQDEGRMQDLSSSSLTEQLRGHVHAHDRRQRYVERALDHLKRERRFGVAYDIVIVGGGLHAAAILYTLRKSNPHLRVLVTEKSSNICSTFAALGDALVLNSPTFSKVGLNSNIVPGHFIQVSDFDEVVERPFPTAKHLHELAAMVFFHADAEIRFDFEVAHIRKSGAGYELSSAGNTVRARRVIIANGMGAPNGASFIVDRRSPNVVFGDDFIARSFADRTYAESFRNKRVAVIGAGDTANCVMEYLVPLVYPNETYGFSRASTELPESILWIGQSAADLREYFFANKLRYCHSGGVVELFWEGDGPLELPPRVWNRARQTIRCVPERLLSLSHATDAIQLKTQSGTIEADLVIDCTGRLNPLTELHFRGDYEFVEGDITLHGGRWDDTLESFTASPRSLKACRIACKLPDEQVFLVGGACPVCELIPDDEARDGSLKHQEHRTSLTNSKWSLEHTLPRSVALANQLAHAHTHR